MSLILTPPPTVMGFFKEISLKNESTGGEYKRSVQRCCQILEEESHSSWPGGLDRTVYKLFTKYY